MADAIDGTIARIQTLADGTWRLIIDCHRKPPNELLEVHATVAVARLTEGGQITKGEYSDLARQLHASGFFLRPMVWLAIGTTLNETSPEAPFRAYLWEQKCWQQGKDCHGDVVCAHVSLTETTRNGERIGGHGTAAKARFSAVPLCDKHHRLQHDKGWTAISPLDSWRKARVEYVSAWAAAGLKKWLGYDHWYNCPPADLVAWAHEQGEEIYSALPADIRYAAEN